MGLHCFVPDVAPLRFFACAAPALMSRDFVFWVAPLHPCRCVVPFLWLRRSSPDVALSCLWGEPPHPWCCPILGVAPSLVLRRPGLSCRQAGGLRHTGGSRAILPPGCRLFVPPHGKSRRLKRRLSHMRDGSPVSVVSVIRSPTWRPNAATRPPSGSCSVP